MKTIAYRQATLATFFLLTFINTMSQPIPGEIPSPTVASLARFGDVPVSLFTGTPRISIPVFTLNSGMESMDMAISLDYDASGILMNALPSWTGYNWTLNVGGVISRQMYGLYDDFVFPAQAHVSNSRRWFDNYGKLVELMAASDRQAAFNNWNYLYDDGPDIFTFSFMGHSGKFYLGNDGQWKVQSDENLDVQFDITEENNYQHTPFMYPKPGTQDLEPKTIHGFTIRDAEGNTYRFGYHPDAIEYTHSFFDMAHNEDVYAWHASAWYLTGVSDKYGNSIFTLTYSRGPYVIQAYNAFSMFNWHTHTEFGYLPNVGLDSFSYHFDDTFPYGFSISSPAYLSKVSSRTGVEVSFITSASPMSSHALYPSLYQSSNLDPYGINTLYQHLAERVTRWALEHPSLGAGDPTFYNEGAFHFMQNNNFSAYRYNGNTNIKDILGYARLKQLNSIEVRNTHSSDQKIKFFLEYEQSPRMHLTKVSTKSYRNYQQTEEYAYRLQYNSFSPLPADCLTRATDHWGYFNGRSQGSYPTNASGSTTYYAQKETDTIYCRNGMLREIVYPTGGATTIEYEPNNYSLYQNEARNGTIQLSSNQVCGGVRIKSLTDWDGPGRQIPARKRTFSYNIPGTGLSSGQLFTKPKYSWEDWTVCTDPGTNSYDVISIFRTASIIPLSNSFGPHVGYSYVEERDSSDNSSSIYHYSNLSDGLADQRFDFSYLDDGSSTPLDMFTERGFWRGKLLLKCDYDHLGRKVRSTGYTYDTLDESFFTYRCNLSFFTPTGSSSNYFRAGGVTRLLSPKVLLTTVRDTVFGGGDFSVTVRALTHQNYHLAMSHPYQHYADVKLVRTEQVSRGGSSERKIFDYPNGYGTSSADYLFNRYFCLAPTAETLYRNNVFVEMCMKTYRTITWPVQYQSPVLEYVPAYYTITYHDGESEDIITYDSYERGGRLTKYTRKGEQPTSITWGYNGAYPVLVGKADGPVVNPYILTDGAENHLDSIRSAISHSPEPVWGYVYNPLYGLTEKVSPNGHVTHYRYDQMGRLSDIYDDGMHRTRHYEYNYSIRY